MGSAAAHRRVRNKYGTVDVSNWQMDISSGALVALDMSALILTAGRCKMIPVQHVTNQEMARRKCSGSDVNGPEEERIERTMKRQNPSAPHSGLRSETK
jgi:hypothetical protein